MSVDIDILEADLIVTDVLERECNKVNKYRFIYLFLLGILFLFNYMYSNYMNNKINDIRTDLTRINNDGTRSWVSGKSDLVSLEKELEILELQIESIKNKIKEGND